MVTTRMEAMSPLIRELDLDEVVSQVPADLLEPCQPPVDPGHTPPDQTPTATPVDTPTDETPTRHTHTHTQQREGEVHLTRENLSHNTRMYMYNTIIG